MAFVYSTQSTAQQKRFKRTYESVKISNGTENDLAGKLLLAGVLNEVNEFYFIKNGPWNSQFSEAGSPNYSVVD